MREMTDDEVTVTALAQAVVTEVCAQIGADAGLLIVFQRRNAAGALKVDGELIQRDGAAHWMRLLAAELRRYADTMELPDHVAELDRKVRRRRD